MEENEDSCGIGRKHTPSSNNFANGMMPTSPSRSDKWTVRGNSFHRIRRSQILWMAQRANRKLRHDYCVRRQQGGGVLSSKRVSGRS